MKLHTLIVILVIIIIIVNKNTALYKVQSTENPEDYFSIVKTTKENDLKKANQLSRLKNKIKILIQSLNITSNEGAKLKQWNIKLEERRNKTDLGYTLNKNIIGLCLEDDENALMFITIHELAHIVTDEIGHTESFWNNFKKLLQQSIDIGIYKYENYNEKSKEYCNKNILYTPIKK